MMINKRYIGLKYKTKEDLLLLSSSVFFVICIIYKRQFYIYSLYFDLNVL